MSKWELHRQPHGFMLDHEYSIWCDGQPALLANAVPGRAEMLPMIVDRLNKHDELHQALLDFVRAYGSSEAGTGGLDKAMTRAKGVLHVKK